MEDSILQRNTIDDHHDFLVFTDKDDFMSQNSISDLVKQSFLLGTEKLFMARKTPTPFDFDSYVENESTFPKFEGKFMSPQLKKVRGRYKTQSYSSNENFNVSKLANDPSANIATFLALLAIKTITFQINMFLKFFMLPISIFQFWINFLLFPFQTLARIRDRMVKSFLEACSAFCLMIVNFVLNRINAQKSVLRMGIRFGKALFSILYVFFILVGLLITGFAMGGFVMRFLVQEPIHTKEMLNFDYTKTSPFAIVPVSSNLGSGTGRAIPYNHKMQLTVSLTMPESEYNRRLGVFQVRVETLSANGKVILGSSYPTMLRFKSQPIRIIETVYKTIPLITGFQAEVQNLKISIGEFTEGIEPTTSYKVILEQRAEFHSGSGVPEIYSASLDIASELPRLRRLVWNWKRTILVWISFSSFLGNLLAVLIFCKPILLLGRKKKGVEKSKKFDLSRLPWLKLAI